MDWIRRWLEGSPYPAALGEGIEAEGRLLRRGRELAHAEVEIAERPGGRLVAQGGVSYRIVVPEGAR